MQSPSSSRLILPEVQFEGFRLCYVALFPAGSLEVLAHVKHSGFQHCTPETLYGLLTIQCWKLKSDYYIFNERRIQKVQMQGFQHAECNTYIRWKRFLQFFQYGWKPYIFVTFSSDVINVRVGKSLERTEICSFFLTSYDHI